MPKLVCEGCDREFSFSSQNALYNHLSVYKNETIKSYDYDQYCGLSFQMHCKYADHMKSHNIWDNL